MHQFYVQLTKGKKFSLIGWFFEGLILCYFRANVVDFKKILGLAKSVVLQKGWKRQLAHSLVDPQHVGD